MKTATTIRECKPGTWITLKETEFPTERQVWIRGEYDRSQRKYELTNWDDICRTKYVKADTVCYVGFTF